MRQEGEERRGTVNMTAEQQADIQAFCEHVPNIDIQADVIVDDEDEIVVGDVATCRITLTRKNLKVCTLRREWWSFTGVVSRISPQCPAV